MQSGDGTEAVSAVPTPDTGRQPGSQLQWGTWDSAQSPCEVGGQVQALLKATKLEKVEKTTSNCCLEQGLFS